MGPPREASPAASPGAMSAKGREAHNTLRYGDALRRLSLVGRRRLRRAFRRLRVQCVAGGLTREYAHTAALVHLAGWVRGAATGHSVAERERLEELLARAVAVARAAGVPPRGHLPPS